MENPTHTAAIKDLVKEATGAHAEMQKIAPGPSFEEDYAEWLRAYTVYARQRVARALDRRQQAKANAEREEANQLFESVPCPEWCTDMRLTLSGMDESHLREAKRELKAHPAVFDVVQNKGRPQELRVFVRPLADGDMITPTSEVQAVLMRLNKVSENLKAFPSPDQYREPVRRPKYMDK